jgi:succinate-acetate transporter protein
VTGGGRPGSAEAMSASASAPTARRTEVVLRPIGNPLPLGLAGLVIASLILSGLDLGWVPIAQSKVIGIVLLTGAVPLQLLACAFALPARDGAAATSMGLLCVSWISMGVVRLLSVPGSTSDPLGLVLLATGTLLAGAALAQAAGKPLAGLALGLAAARLILSALYELTHAGGWQTVSGIVGLAVVATTAYLVIALQMEDAQDRPVLPTFRRGRAELSGHADGAVREAGVRPQL